MQMAGETHVPRQQPVFLTPVMHQVVPDWLMDTRPYRVRGYRIGKLTTSDPRACNDFTAKKRIPELHFKTNLCGLSDHRGVAANGLNIVEFQFRSGDLNSSALRFISFLWSSEEDSAGSLSSAEKLLQQEHPFLQLN